jgi:hypothetical protein
MPASECGIRWHSSVSTLATGPNEWASLWNRLNDAQMTGARQVRSSSAAALMPTCSPSAAQAEAFCFTSSRVWPE